MAMQKLKYHPFMDQGNVFWLSHFPALGGHAQIVHLARDVFSIHEGSLQAMHDR